jgi:hypothetical protein
VDDDNGQGKMTMARWQRATLLNKRTVIDHLIREIKMNAVILHACSTVRRFRKTLVGQFSLLDEIVKRLQPHEARSRGNRTGP